MCLATGPALARASDLVGTLSALPAHDLVQCVTALGGHDPSSFVPALQCHLGFGRNCQFFPEGILLTCLPETQDCGLLASRNEATLTSEKSPEILF